jgi:hypothetical protein
MYMMTWVTANGESTFGRNAGDRLEHTTAGSKIVGLSAIPVAPVNPTTDGLHAKISSGIVGRRIYATKAGAPATGVTPTTAQWFLTVADGATTIAAGSNNFTLPQGTISVASGAAVASGGGNIIITTTNGPQMVTYTAVSTNDLTGCTGGSGLMVTGQTVTQPMIPNNTATTFNVNLADASFTATTPPVQDTAGRRIIRLNLAASQTVGEHRGDNVWSCENGGGFSVEVTSGTVDWELSGG